MKRDGLEIFTELCGTCNDNRTEEELADNAITTEIDDLMFRCATCSWWCEAGESCAECSDNEEICNDCCTCEGE